MARRVGDTEGEVAALAAFCDARSGPAYVRERIEAAGRMLALADHHALPELLGRRLRLRARLELGDLTGVDARHRRVCTCRGPAPLTDLQLAGAAVAWNAGCARRRPGWESVRRRGGHTRRGGSERKRRDDGLGTPLENRTAATRHACDRELPGLMAEWAEHFPGWDCTFALLFAESGDPERGRRHLRRLMDAGLDSLPVDSEWVEVLWLLGEAAMQLNERDAARAVHDALSRTRICGLWMATEVPASARSQNCSSVSRTTSATPRPPRRAVRHSCGLARSGGRVPWPVRYSAGLQGHARPAALLGRPGQEVHVLDLVEGSGGPSRAEAGTDTGPMIDAAARSAYRRRLVDLEEEIDDASRDHDQGRLEKLGAEKDFLAAELSAALGLGGRCGSPATAPSGPGRPWPCGSAPP